MGKHLIAGAVAAATLFATAAIAQEKLTVGLALPEGMAGAEPVNGMYEVFKEELESATDGEITVDLVYGGALGKPDERLNMMRRGSIQMSDAADGNIATVYPDIQVFSMPYLFPDEETAMAALNGPIGDRMAEDIQEETGIRVLGWWESGGFKHYSANAPIETPEDLSELKMRAIGPIFRIAVEATGGSAVNIPFSELYTALKTGVVDGQDNAAWVFNLMKFYEVQSHLSLTGHIYAFGPLGINNDWYESQSEDMQAAIDAAADKAITFNIESSRAASSGNVAKAKEHGVTVVELSGEQRAAFAEVVQPKAIEWLRETIDTPALVDEVQAEVERLSE